MNRRDRLTYDVGTERQRLTAAPSPKMVVLLIGVIVSGVLLVAWTLHGSTSARTADGAGVPPRSSSQQPTPTGTTTPGTAPSTARAITGSDAEAVAGAPKGSAQAAEQFVLAWLEKDPDLREPALKVVAIPGLVEQLMLTSRDNIPDTSAVGDPMLQDASTYSVEFAQELQNGKPVRIYLVADPEARYGWLTTSVEQG